MKIVLPFLPERPSKPRNSGLTMVMDKGLSIREAEDFMSVGSQYTDYVKLGFGTSLITPGFEKKISIYKKAGTVPYFGGTLFEAFVVRNMFSEYVDFLNEHEITLVEVSDGSYDIDHNKKLEYISRLAERGTVISEVGSKKKDVIYTPEEWVEMMKSELKAGSVKVIAEARESGTTGIYYEDGSINNELIGAISEHVKLDNVIWEAPLKSQQAWFIRHFGTLRLGLRGDTFFQFLPEGLA